MAAIETIRRAPMDDVEDEGGSMCMACRRVVAGTRHDVKHVTVAGVVCGLCLRKLQAAVERTF